MSESKAVATIDVKGARVFDGFDNFAARVGLNNANVLSFGTYTLNLITRNRLQLEAAYRGSWIVGQVIDVIPEDMTKSGIEITTNDEEQDIAEFQAEMNNKQIWTSLSSLLKWGRLYGGAIAVMQIEGQNLATPLNHERISKGQFKGLTIFDRWQVQPDLQTVIRSGPEMGLPAFYEIITTASTATPEGTEADGGIIRVHHSRIIRNIGIELPFFQAITEQMWGESTLERLWDRLVSFDQATMSTANLIERANNRTIGIENFREIVAAGGDAQKGLEAQFEMMRIFQTNEGMTLMDKNDTFATTNYTFSGLSDVLIQFGQQLSGASRIPLVRLFGQSPAGLSATGESDLRMYYDHINSEQNAKLRPGLTRLLPVMWASLFGRPAPKDLSFTFVPLWQMSALDKATIATSTVGTLTTAADAGLIKRSTAMKELRASTKETGLFNNITDEDVAEAEEEEQSMPPEPDATLPAPAEEKKEGDLDAGPDNTLDENKGRRKRFSDWLFKPKKG